MKKKLKIKVCGLINKNNIFDISFLFPEFIGFIFYSKSPRFVGKNYIAPNINNSIYKVGVFVNSSKEEILKKSIINKLNYVQLHGNESPKYCEYLIKKGIKIIKVFKINKNFSFKESNNYTDLCDYFLFDTNTIYYGGSGKKFPWNKIYEYYLDIPFFISGGISIEDYKSILNISHPKLIGIDINSKFEIFPGIKNITLLDFFLKKIRI